MRFDPALIRATLLRRYKRFLADVRLEDGTEITVHCANPGSMLEVSVPGQPVLLSHSNNPKRKLPHTWELIRLSRSWIGVNTARTNAFVEEAIRRDRIAELHGYPHLRREVRAGDSRIDFLLGGGGKTDCLVEVKNVTLTDGNDTAIFPDSVTVRGQKHLSELMRIAHSGRRAVMLFWVNRRDCRGFSTANDIDPAYGRLLREARDQGVEILAYRAKVSPKQVTADRSIPILL
ncbi:MAG: DNA/RNA nuclease SfsA, partial [Planctomycetota bacterium]